MKYLIGVMFLMLAQVARAQLCRVNNGPWMNPLYGEINVNVDFEPDYTNNAFKAVGYRLECKHDKWPVSSHALDVLTLNNSVGFVMPYFNMLHNFFFNGTPRGLPVPAGLLIGRQEGNASSTVMTGGPSFLLSPQTALTHVNIVKGQQMAYLLLRLKTWRFSVVETDINVRVNFYANNSYSTNPATCTINNNNPIDVNFGSVDPLVSGGDSSSLTPYSTTVNLNYSCPTAGISSVVYTKLQGTASSFNPSALATSNENLAVAMTRGTSVVALGSSFNTTVTRSSGSNTVNFKLIRKPGSVPAGGLFNANATLILSAP